MIFSSAIWYKQKNARVIEFLIDERAARPSMGRYGRWQSPDHMIWTTFCKVIAHWTNPMFCFFLWTIVDIQSGESQQSVSCSQNPYTSRHLIHSSHGRYCLSHSLTKVSKLQHTEEMATEADSTKQWLIRKFYHTDVFTYTDSWQRFGVIFIFALTQCKCIKCPPSLIVRIQK